MDQWDEYSRWSTLNYTDADEDKIKQVHVRPFSRWQPYIHTCRSYVHTPRDIPRTSHLYRTKRPARGPRKFFRFWAFEGAKFPKMGDSLPWTPMNRRAKYDAAIALSSAEKSVTVQTHTHTHTHTHNKKTVTDISTPCLSACVDNKTMKR